MLESLTNVRRALALSAAEAKQVSHSTLGSSSNTAAGSSTVIDLTDDDDIVEIPYLDTDLKKPHRSKEAKTRFSETQDSVPEPQSALTEPDLTNTNTNPSLSPSRTAPQTNLQAFFSERAALEKARLERQKQVLGKRSTPTVEDQPVKRLQVLLPFAVLISS